jgi:ribosomal protein S4
VARRIGVIAFAGAATRPPWARAREREEGQHSLLSGEEVAIKEQMHQNAMVLEARNVAQSQSAVPWLEQDREQFKAKVVALPKREDVQTPPINEQLIVELYSK